MPFALDVEVCLCLTEVAATLIFISPFTWLKKKHVKSIN